jgi:hypothetical protein
MDKNWLLPKLLRLLSDHFRENPLKCLYIGVLRKGINLLNAIQARSQLRHGPTICPLKILTDVPSQASCSPMKLPGEFNNVVVTLHHTVTLCPGIVYYSGSSSLYVQLTIAIIK